jgi:hypothetical protein
VKHSQGVEKGGTNRGRDIPEAHGADEIGIHRILVEVELEIGHSFRHGALKPLRDLLLFSNIPVNLFTIGIVVSQFPIPV